MADCMSTGARRSFSAVKEDTWGVVPTTPTLQEIGVRAGGAPVQEKPLIQSQSIRSDRQMPSARTGNKNINVPFVMEVRYGEQDEFWEALFGDTFTQVTDSSVGVDFDAAGTITRTVGDWTNSFKVGDSIKVTGSGLNDGIYTIITLTATVLTISTQETLQTEATQTIDVTKTELENGTNVFSFTFEEFYGDLNDANKYTTWSGARPNTLGLASTIDDHIVSTWEFIGKSGGVPAAASVGTVTPQTTNESMIHYDGKIFIEDGEQVDLTALTVNFDNSVANEFVLGSDEAGCQQIGAFKVSGTFDALFNDFQFQEWQTSEQELQMRVNMADPDGNQYVLHIDAFKLGTVSRNIEENRITEGIPFEAYISPTTGKTARLFRFLGA